MANRALMEAKRQWKEGEISVEEYKAIRRGLVVDRRGSGRRSQPLKTVAQVTGTLEPGTKVTTSQGHAGQVVQTPSGESLVLATKPVIPTPETIGTSSPAPRPTNIFEIDRREKAKERFITHTATQTPEQRIYRSMGYDLEYKLGKATTQDREDAIYVSPQLAKLSAKTAEREQRLETGKDWFYKKVGLQAKPGESRVVGEVKFAIRTPVEIGSMVPVILGRAYWTGAALTEPGGRQELGQAFGRVPGAVAKSYNPKETGFFTNVALTALAIKGTQLDIKRRFYGGTPKTQVVAESGVTKRTMSETALFDETWYDATVKVGKKQVDVVGRGTQEFVRVGEKTYVGEGVAEVTQLPKLKKTIAETRSISTIRADKGIDTTSFIKTPKGRYIQTTETYKPAVQKPFQEFFERGTTSEVLGKGVYSFEPRKTGIGYSRELYVEDIFKPGKNIFSKDVFTESGEFVSTERLLTTERLGASSSSLKQVSRSDFSKAFAQRQVFPESTVTTPTTGSSGTGSLKLFKQTGSSLEQAPVTSVSGLRQLAVEIAVESAGKPSGKSFGITLPKSSKMPVPTRTSSASPISKVKSASLGFDITTSPTTKPFATDQFTALGSSLLTGSVLGQKSGQSTSQISTQRTSQLLRQRSSQKSVLGLKPAISSIQDITTLGALKVSSFQSQIQLQRTLTRQRTIQREPQIGIPTTSFVDFTPPPPTGGGGLFPWDRKNKEKKKTKKGKKSKVSSYTFRLPSVEAVTLDITARKINPRVYQTGLELRPIKV